MFLSLHDLLYQMAAIVLYLKFINAKHAREVYKYKNTKQKLRRTIAAIWYNKSCRDRNINPNYFNIRIKGNN